MKTEMAEIIPATMAVLVARLVVEVAEAEEMTVSLVASETTIARYLNRG